LWDAVRGNLIHAQTFASPFHRIAFHPDGKRFVLGGSDGRIMSWNVTTHQQVWQTSLANCCVTGLAFSADGKTVAATTIASSDSVKGSAITLWDAESGKWKQRIDACESGCLCVDFHPTLPLLAFGGEDKTIRFWNLGSGKSERPPLRGHQGAIDGLAFSPDGQCLVSASKAGNLKIWNLGPAKDAPHESILGTILPQSFTRP